MKYKQCAYCKWYKGKACRKFAHTICFAGTQRDKEEYIRKYKAKSKNLD